MKCINFDERFADFTAKWMKEHRGEYKTTTRWRTICLACTRSS